MMYEFYLYLYNMWTLFKILRGFFYFLTIVTGIVYMRGEVLFGGNFDLIKNILIPGYLVFCGLMFGYLVATFWVGREKYKEEVNKERIATRSLIVGVVGGIVFNIIYLFS